MPRMRSSDCTTARVLTGQDSLDQAVQRSSLRPQRQGNRQATSVEIVGIGVPERNHMGNVGNVAQPLGLETSCGFLQPGADVAEFSPKRLRRMPGTNEDAPESREALPGVVSRGKAP